MSRLIFAGITLLTLGIALAATPRSATAGTPAPAMTSEARDCRLNFDFEIGSWRTVVKRLRKPLSGSSDWVE